MFCSLFGTETFSLQLSPSYTNFLYQTSSKFRQYFNPFSEYTSSKTEMINLMPAFDYAKQTEWIIKEELVDKDQICKKDIDNNPQSAVECFQKNNPEFDQEIFSIQIPEEMNNSFQEIYCNVGGSDGNLENQLEIFIKNQIQKKYNLSNLEKDSGDVLRMDSARNGLNNMNHFYSPRGDKIKNDPKNPKDEKVQNAGPQAFHQDGSSLAISSNSKTFLMLYTACSDNLDDSRSGTWISSASKTFFNAERILAKRCTKDDTYEECLAKQCTKDDTYEECWAKERKNEMNTYESGLFRAPRFTQGYDWSKLNYIDPIQEKKIKNLKRFQQIPAKAGNVLVIMEKNILHAGPEVLPKNLEVLNQMKRTVVRRRFSKREEKSQEVKTKLINEVIESINEMGLGPLTQSQAHSVLVNQKWDRQAAVDTLVVQMLM